MPLDAKDMGQLRPGNRGGLGLFKWEEVAKDKDKSHYIGNSVKSATGLWARRKNLDWFHLEKEETSQVSTDELAEIKRREAEAMAEMLGAKVDREQGNDYAKEKIKKDLESHAMTQERIVGLGVQGYGGISSSFNEMNRAAKRDIVKETKRSYRNREYEERQESFSSKHRHEDDDSGRHKSRKSVERSDRHRERSRSRERHRHRERHDSRERPSGPSERSRHRDRHDSRERRHHRDRSGSRERSEKRHHRERQDSRERRPRERSRSRERRPRDRDDGR